ncbi:hypothetical protein F511_27110 [Dorcoceras hygrometricum]|uniref:Uncharacterized protein n=1 Tax=Dorcoceras hygrometricum TaxID=472368 RepID=A0A2Z7D5U4_9LAMI|nr:hypothetical protein F511_27110 [Dorcoceras hygrometricum]
MSLFDLQDLCIAIGSIATLDLPMVVDLIGIYGLKGSYCTLTTTNWFLQALSVIPRGSWGHVSRRFTMIRWAVHSRPSLSSHKPPPPPPPPRVAGIRSGQFDEENQFVQNLSVLLVQADKGVSVLVVDRIGDIYRSLPRRADVIVTTVGARHKCQQCSGFEPPIFEIEAVGGRRMRRTIHRARSCARGRALVAPDSHAMASRSCRSLAHRLHEIGEAGALSCTTSGARSSTPPRIWMRDSGGTCGHAPHEIWRSSVGCWATLGVRRSDAKGCWSTMGRRLCDGGRTKRALVLRRCARRCACAAAILFSSWWRHRRRRPPLRRVSGDVVTAGLISSRVWFGPVPGSP